jgi:hypothetical protein
MSDDPSTTTSNRRRSGRDNLLIVMGVLVVLAAALAIAARDVWMSRDTAPTPSANDQQVTADTDASKIDLKRAIVESDVIDDDGHSMWVSPTDGPPLDLAYLPPGVEMVLAMRPAKLLAHSESEKVLAALGPRGESAMQWIESRIGMPLRDVERLVIGWQVTRDGTYLPSLIVTTATPIETEGDTFQPKSTGGRVSVFGSDAALADIRMLQGQPPPLARDLERLLDRTDGSRDVTLLIQPRLLLRDGNTPFPVELRPLRRAVDSLLSQNAAAAELSLDWSDDFFVELIAVPTLDSSPEELSVRLKERVHAWPELVEEAVLKMNSSPYSRRVVARMPEMVRRLSAYTRIGYDDDCAILRCYLPIAAGHNLLMAGELALAEGQGSPATGVASNGTAAQTSESITERLQKKTTLRFGREELEAALNMLSEDVGVPIAIRGRDLQLDGITRNQLFAIDVADRPADEILVEILRRANPDKTATGPADPRQKLVYVVGPDSIIITTRAAATAKGETLPPVFQLK